MEQLVAIQKTIYIHDGIAIFFRCKFKTLDYKDEETLKYLSLFQKKRIEIGNIFVVSWSKLLAPSSCSMQLYASCLCQPLRLTFIFELLFF